jgi:hypothetical protein
MGELQLRDHDEVAWIKPEEFSQYELAPADLPTVEALLEGRGRACPQAK